MAVINPNLPPKGHLFFAVSVSVSSSGSAQAAGVGPFAGIFCVTSASFTITGNNGNTMAIDNAAKNAFIWMEGAFISIIATATSQFGVI